MLILLHRNYYPVKIFELSLQEKLTKFGGIQLVRKFFEHLKPKEELERAVPVEKREGKFSVGGMLVSHLYAVILDMKRQSDTLMLRLDKVFQKIAGVDGYPAQSTISRFLKGFTVGTAKEIAKVNHLLIMRGRKNFDGWHKITLDVDSHVKTVYGHQQRASVGYNPKKPGRPSFHSSRGVRRFVDNCLKKTPEGIKKIFLRADSGFYNGDFLNHREKNRILYAEV